MISLQDRQQVVRKLLGLACVDFGATDCSHRQGSTSDVLEPGSVALLQNTADVRLHKCEGTTIHVLFLNPADLGVGRGALNDALQLFLWERE